MLQKMASQIPMMTSSGNHELELQADGTVFAAYTTRCGLGSRGRRTVMVGVAWAGGGTAAQC